MDNAARQTNPRRSNPQRDVQEWQDDDQSSSTETSQQTADHGSSHTIIFPPDTNDQASLKTWELGHQKRPSSHMTAITIDVNNPPPARFRVYPIAWVCLFFLVFLRAAGSIYSNTFSPIPAITAHYLGVDLTQVNWLFNVQAIMYIAVSFVTSWLFETLGVKKSLMLAGFLTTVGCWIRWVAVKMTPPSFAVLMVGQIVAAVGSPISLNIMTKFASVWFTEERRATAGMFVASNYGGIIAMFLMPAVATGEDKIEFTLIMVAVICTAATVPQFLLPARPPTPPSIEFKPTAIEKPSLWRCTITLMKNVHFWILCGIHGINVGLSIAWGGLFNQAVTPYGYSNAEAGNVVAVGLVVGTLGCQIAGPILDLTKQHKLFLRMMAPLMCTTYVAMIFIIHKDSFASILYVNALNQFFLAFMVPIVIELGVEVSYPVPESVSTSILWQFAQIIGFILVLVMDRFRDPSGTPANNMYKGLVFQAAVSGACVLLCWIFRGSMLRTEAYQNALKAGELQTKQADSPDSSETLSGIIDLNEKTIGKTM